MAITATGRHLSWAAFAGLIVTTIVDAPTLRSESATTPLGLDELFTVRMEALASLTGDATPKSSSERLLLPLQSDFPETVSHFPLELLSSSALEYLADERGASSESANGATGNQGVDTGGQVAAGSVGFTTDARASSGAALAAIGAHWASIPMIALATTSGSTFGTIDIAALTATTPSLQPDRKITTSPRTEGPNDAVVADASHHIASVPAQAHPASSPSFGIGKEEETSPDRLITYGPSVSDFPSRASMDNGKAIGGLDFGQTPNVVNPVTALASESQEPSEMAVQELDRLASNVARENGDEQNVILTAPVPFDAIEASTPLLSTGVPFPLAVPEPATLALFGIGLAGLGFSRRKQ